MAVSLENFLTNFLRTFPEPFPAKELVYMINALGHDLTLEELTEFLDNDARVFSLQKKMYITRAGAFQDKLFSITLSQKEIEQKVLIPGDRCMPFVDGEQFSFALKFEFLGKRLKTKRIELDKSSALDLFTLYGEEYSVQYVASDPECAHLHIAESDFELPPKVFLTCVDISSVMNTIGFKKGDRLIARVKDWAGGVIELYPLCDNKENPYSISNADIERQKWFEILEDALLKSFEKMGPCSGMEEQLANVFYEHSAELCVPGCASIHEFLNWSKKVSIEYFGVETRLWYKGQDIPAIGKWNLNTYGAGSEGNLPYFSIPDFLIDSYIKDSLYEKNNDISLLIKKIIPKDLNIPEDEISDIKEQIEMRNSMLRKTYNWFADFAFGSIRHKALELYSKVESFVYDIDCLDKEFGELPQQELVTLSQLFTHVARILEITAGDAECGEDETYAMQLSLEGMEANFEEIKPPITAALNRLRKNHFNVI